MLVVYCAEVVIFLDFIVISGLASADNYMVYAVGSCDPHVFVIVLDSSAYNGIAQIALNDGNFVMASVIYVHALLGRYPQQAAAVLRDMCYELVGKGFLAAPVAYLFFVFTGDRVVYKYTVRGGHIQISVFCRAYGCYLFIVELSADVVVVY